jgi:putative transposase
MPRPARLHVPGGYYHVILRGNHREALFGHTRDRHALNDIVADVVRRFEVRIHAFCWMSNHLHALLQIADRPLGQVMQRIAVRYSRYRHKSLRTTGHLFERRYRAKLVDVDAYFLTLLRYIHLNPVKARMVSDPADYPWSSHRAYLGTESSAWVTTKFGLSLFSTDLARARRAYGQFILQSSADESNLEEHSHPDDSRILGTDSFIASIPLAPHKLRSHLTLEQLAASICHQHSISLQLLRSPSRARRLARPRLVLATQAVEQHIATLADVARFLHRDPSALTKLLARHERKRMEP